MPPVLEHSSPFEVIGLNLFKVRVVFHVQWGESLTKPLVSLRVIFHYFVIVTDYGEVLELCRKISRHWLEVGGDGIF